MLAIALVGAMAAADADRLAFGSHWHCQPVGSDDRYALDFAIEPGKGPMPKKLHVTEASGGITAGIEGYGFEHGEKNSTFDPREAAKDQFYPIAEFTHGFSNYGVSAMAMWWKGRPALDLTLRTFNYEYRSDPARRNERVYVLSCLPAEGSGSIS